MNFHLLKVNFGFFWQFPQIKWCIYTTIWWYYNVCKAGCKYSGISSKTAVQTQKQTQAQAHAHDSASCIVEYKTWRNSWQVNDTISKTRAAFDVLNEFILAKKV